MSRPTLPAPRADMAPTPSQTVGPFYGYALPFLGGGDIAPAGHPETVTLHGHVLDGAGAPVPDAVIEVWQPAPDGSRAGAPGSMRRDPVDGAFIGRDGLVFTGFGRVATDADGRYAVRTLPPGGVPYVSLAVFARGLLHHLYTRAYLHDASGLTADPLLAGLPAGRRATLVTRPDGAGVHRFDVRLQGDARHEETVFLDFG
ncbi:protocatechuate 3,4-dioxygenase subunit alpha [Streptomyces sp. NBC_01754]|uniref:protocatechuate 3,4-dioxygenase subunit alpha n=1 Tax=Streptomyces sp. NBC_01754 TaxID=2975930 RepID=UPI002DDC3D97|nr:protocatechuate 3,4-dioxygenase subunit alpha [Streptomyces sp. NBC_01754]WSC94039.1 protocatechuate 3,4-dioxygenase subunit alpha [Streptomyces sp. NBC_01754]